MNEWDKGQENNLSRRTFLGTAVAAGAVLAACSTPSEPQISLGPKMEIGPKLAPDGAPIKAGLIGCGGRGSGAAMDFLNSGPNLEIVAIGDVFPDQVAECRRKIKEQKGVDIPEELCFSGFDAYQKVIDAGVDYIIIATPPAFRPQQFAAAIDARKHVFMEKPVAVDPVGVKTILAAGERAEALGLKVATGTQRRHQRAYIETYNRIMDGAIGEIVSARCYWNQGQLWFKERAQGWSDMEWMIRDWVNWIWLSGDHIVEQHIHNIDVVNWFTNSHPVKAVGMGGRHRRVTGDQYDFFAVDYEMDNGMHVLSMCRQIDGCVNNVSEFIVGTKGSTNCHNTIYGPDGTPVWTYKPPAAEGDSAGDNSPYVQEHIDLITAIRQNKPLNETRNTAISTLIAIMGREAAYTGRQITFDEMMASEMRLGPTDFALGPSDLINAVIPVPGTERA